MDVAVKPQLRPLSLALAVASHKTLEQDRQQLLARARQIVSSVSKPNRIAISEAVEDLKNLGERKLMDLMRSYSTMSLEDALAQCALQVESTSAIKSRGAIFTPNWLAKRVSRRAAQWWERLDPGRPRPRSIADLSCGSGVFLEAAFEAFGPGVAITGQDRGPYRR